MTNRQAYPIPFKPLIILFICCILGWFLTVSAINACTTDHNPPQQSLSDILASTDLTQITTNTGVKEYVKQYEGFTVSFNPDLHIPNWVAWTLSPEQTDGPETRRPTFTTDSSVPGCPTTADYRNSGFDRGHMAPAGDMKWSRQAMTDCFNLTNIAPQTKALNTGQWNALEQAARRWTHLDSTLTIICGPILTPAPATLIGQNEVAVPNSFFKIIVAPYADPPRAIAFIFQNTDTPEKYINAATTIRQVEDITGHDFLTLLPDSIQTILETQNQIQRWTKR